MEKILFKKFYHQKIFLKVSELKIHPLDLLRVFLYQKILIGDPGKEIYKNFLPTDGLKSILNSLFINCHRDRVPKRVTNIIV
jgi:hypothetical protein